MAALRRPVGALRAHPLAVIVVLALVLRLGLVAATPNHFPAGDGVDYLRHAVTLAEVGRYPGSALAAPGSPSAFRPPAYPYALAAVFELAGVRVDAARALNALLGAISAALAFLIAAELWGRREAVCAGLLAAVYPPLVLMSGVLLAENLFIALMLGGVFACLRLRAPAAPLAWTAAVGALGAAAALTRPNGVVVLVALLAGVLASVRGTTRRRLAYATGALLAATLVLAPWTVRNALAFDALVPVSTGTGISLAGQLNPVAAADGPAQAAPRLPDQIPEYLELVRREGVDEVELDDRLRSGALDFAAGSPRYILEATRLNVLRAAELGGDPSFVGLWDAERDATGIRHGLWVGGFWALLAVVLAAIAVPRTRRRVAEAPVWIWLIPTLLLLSTVPLDGKPRYRLAVDPFLVLVAGVAAGGRRRRAESQT